MSRPLSVESPRATTSYLFDSEGEALKEEALKRIFKPAICLSFLALTLQDRRHPSRQNKALLKEQGKNNPLNNNSFIKK